MTIPFREEIDTTLNHNYDDLTINWFRLQGLDKIKAIIRKEVNTELDKRIYLFGRHDDCFKKGAQIFIHLYDLPADTQEFEKTYNFYEKQRKSFNLTNNRKFNETILNLSLISDHFHEHNSFQVKDGNTRRRIVHIYRNNYRGIIVVFSLDTNEFIENSFFNEVAENCEIKNT